MAASPAAASPASPAAAASPPPPPQPPPPTSFLPSSASNVDEALAASAFLSQGRSVVLPANRRVVIRADVEAVKARRRVAVVCGGGSGHEPAHAGLVGRGLLTCAIAGDVFASPPVADILDGIRASTSSSEGGGALLIVKNYTGDIVNFTQAANQARQEFGLKVELIVVADDASGASQTHRRGLAGTLLVQKLAGAAAELGWNLEDVQDIAKGCLPRLASVNLGFGHCTLPGKASRLALPEGTAEFGLGIHGEPGAEIIAKPDVGQAASMLVTKLVNALLIKQDDAVVLMINNLGCMSQLEMLCFSHRVKGAIEQRGVFVARVYFGTLMTALGTPGLSLSMLARPSDNELSLLDFPVDCLGWGPHSPTAPSPLPSLAPKVHSERKKLKSSLPSPGVTVSALLRGLDALIANADSLDVLDSKCGDGDCGASVASTASRLRTAVKGMTDPLDSENLLLAAEAACAGGSLGGILRAFFANARQQETWQEAVSNGLRAAQSAGGAWVGHRSFLDALVPASEAETLHEAAFKARHGAESTKSLIAKVGRAVHVPQTSYLGHADPGAEAVALFFEALVQRD